MCCPLELPCVSQHPGLEPLSWSTDFHSEHLQTFIQVFKPSQKRYKHVLMDGVAVTFPSALQSTALLLSVLLSFSPVEVDIAKTDCQTVHVLLCLNCLVFLVHVAC